MFVLCQTLFQLFSFNFQSQVDAHMCVSSVIGMVIKQHCHYLTYEVSGALKTQTQAICPTVDVYNGGETWESLWKMPSV